MVCKGTKKMLNASIFVQLFFINMKIILNSSVIKNLLLTL